MKYYIVEVKCGHIKRGWFLPKAFPVKAENKKEAAKIARRIPRVKHDNKYAILNAKEITFDEYSELIKINNSDPYLKCKNKQEQRIVCPNIIDEAIKEEVPKKYRKSHLRSSLIQEQKCREWKKYNYEEEC